MKQCPVTVEAEGERSVKTGEPTVSRYRCQAEEGHEPPCVFPLKTIAAVAARNREHSAWQNARSE